MRDPPGQGQGGEILAIWFIPGRGPGLLWPAVTTSPLDLSINEKRDTSHHQTCSTNFTVIQKGFIATWKQLKHIMTHFRLFAEWEQTCDMRGGGGLRHHHSASQTRLRWVVSSSELFHWGGETYFLTVHLLTPSQQRPVPMSWLGGQRDIVSRCKSSLDDRGKCKCWCKWAEW